LWERRLSIIKKQTKISIKMKRLFITIFLGLWFVINMSAQRYELPQDHQEITAPCDCNKVFKDTKTWNKGKRGGYFCLWTITRGSKKGQKRKRYYSELAKKNKK
jgi:uncharacterized C2H2 Zn-finger protein